SSSSSSSLSYLWWKSAHLGLLFSPPPAAAQPFWLRPPRARGLFGPGGGAPAGAGPGGGRPKLARPASPPRPSHPTRRDFIAQLLEGLPRQEDLSERTCQKPSVAILLHDARMSKGPRSGRDMPLCVGAGAAAAGGRPMLRLRSDPCLGRPGPGARPPCPEQPPRPRRASTGTVAAPPAPKAPPRPAARRLAPGEPLSPPGRAAEARSPRLRGGPSPRCGGESPRGDSPSFGRLATPAFVWPREPACHSARSAASTTASGSCASCVSCASAASSPGPGSSTSSPEAPREVFAEAEPALRSARAGPCGGRPPAGAAAGGQSRGLGPFLGGAAPRRAGPPRRRGCDMPGMAPLRALCAERSCLKQRVGAEERAAVFEGSVLLRLEEIRLLGRRAAR
ncbi:unnamed protein product, partial [Prorocentrum cordatum]